MLNIYVSQKEKRKSVVQKKKNIFEEVKAEDSANLVKDINIRI